MKETDVDWLSVAIGNIHGAISGVAKDKEKVQARLNIEHLKKIRKATGIPLVLHGGSGIQKPYLMEAIKNGITKINVGTSIRQSYEKALLQSDGNIEEAQKAVAKTMEHLIRNEYEIEGSWDRLVN